MGLMYPAIPRDMKLSAETPPAFLMCGEKDRATFSQGLAPLFLELERAGVPAELRILGGVGHGFGMRYSNPPAVAAWPNIFYAWLSARHILSGRVPAPGA